MCGSALAHSNLLAESANLCLIDQPPARFGLRPTGLFSYHPPLQTLSIVLFVQGILTLQPTRTRQEKQAGLNFHQTLQFLGSLAVIAGVSLMIANKAVHHGELGGVSTLS